MLKKKLPALAILLLICLLGLLLTGCGGEQSDDTKEPASEQTGRQQADQINLAGGDWGYPNPYTYYPRGPGSRKMSLVFDSLVTSDTGGNIQPALAAEWQSNKDGLAYTFKLRPGAEWHDGKPFTADDVIFSYEYAKSYPPVSAVDLTGVKKMSAVDDLTILVELIQSDPNFLAGLAGLKIIPRHIWENVTDPLNFVAPGAAVGTGPYRLVDYSKEHGTYRFEASDKFWGEQPRVKVLAFIPASEDILAFEQGEIDRINITPDVLSRFESNPEYRVMQYETTWAYRLYFNMKNRPELLSKDLRRALVYAVDRRDLVEKVERGAAVPGNPGVLHPGNELYNPDVPQYPYDRQKAEELLEGLGYQEKADGGVRQNSKGEKLSFLLLADEGSSRLGELIKQQLALVGVEVRVQVVDQKTRDDRFKNGDYELCINGSGGGESLEELTNLARARATSATGETMGYKNPGLDSLYSRQEKETDPARRKELMAELQRIVAEEVPKITLYYRNTLAVHRPAVYDGWSEETYHHDQRINFVKD
ncbi:oligopeptide ABC transporter OppA [Desulfocucumis palustris]|uniref:Oligopeptide ABC transporter OppA n=1 Tax=Desulfocucumis palustris TaxID=1898651 RepID=A0A2L2XA21_9FIRM|nr:ABC transporter substrate-binding protein [Desulfocucumis palustris]GBF33109.1 oligopeptide ABC transporter OppA [Desulfocucumis palustris]